jgi:hypothetical protein
MFLGFSRTDQAYFAAFLESVYSGLTRIRPSTNLFLCPPVLSCTKLHIFTKHNPCSIHVPFRGDAAGVGVVPSANTCTKKYTMNERQQFEVPRAPPAATHFIVLTFRHICLYRGIKYNKSQHALRPVSCIILLADDRHIGSKAVDFNRPSELRSHPYSAVLQNLGAAILCNRTTTPSLVHELPSHGCLLDGRHTWERDVLHGREGTGNPLNSPKSKKQALQLIPKSLVVLCESPPYGDYCYKKKD